MKAEQEHLFEEDKNGQEIGPDPEEIRTKGRKLYTQPYDLVVGSLLDQVEKGILFLRPISDRPRFQRRYVWTDILASKLIESILLNVPIPQCYLAQNDNFELDVIDGQQRIYSIYRFVKNQFKLNGLQVLEELNNKYFFELPTRLQKQINTFVLRCVVITNDSDRDIRFDVFERLNSNTVPLNTQELRNCIFRGSLIDLVNHIAENESWLKILGRKEPDKRMLGEELVLRFFAFQLKGVGNYQTPQKVWLNSVALEGRNYPDEKKDYLETLWKKTIQNCLIIFQPHECFRRLPLEGKSAVINRALMDLTMNSLAKLPTEKKAKEIAAEFKIRYTNILKDDEFSDLITRAIDHKSRTQKRFDIWKEKVETGLIV